MQERRKNIIVVAGSGRNTGKTRLIEVLIQRYKNLNPLAIKISPHFHTEIPKAGFRVVNEFLREGKKDSSRFLLAGAKESMYVESTDEKLKNMMHELSGSIPDEGPVFFESGGITKVLTPALIVFLLNPNHLPLNDPKKRMMELADWVIDTSKFSVQDIANSLEFLDNEWKKV